MGKNWKKKVSDFFFYEKELIEEVKEEVQEVKPETINRQMTETNRAVNAKVTYQYPKEEETPFRFPVIPDIDAEELSVRKRRKQIKTVTNLENDLEKDPLIYGYHRQKSVKELDDVPAFMRRREIRQTQQKDHEEVVEQKEADHPLLNHTRPDELDRVFRKRDGLLEEEAKKKQPRQSRRTGRTNTQSIDQPSEVEQKIVERTSSSQEAHVAKVNQSKEEHEAFNNVPKVDEVKPLAYHDDQHHSMSSVEDKQDHEHQVSSESFPTEQTANQVELMEDVPSYLLNDPVIPTDDDTEWLREQQLLLEQTLKHFKIKASIVNVTQGPAVTRFEVQPALGVKVSRIRNLADDIKLNMSAKDIRIEAPIPGKN